MSQRAWTYVWSIYALAVVLALQAAVTYRLPHPDWTMIAVLFGLAIGAQLFRVETPNHVVFYATPVLFFCATLLLVPILLFLLILLAHLVEWLKERSLRTASLRAWYLQPFNIAMYWIAARAAQHVYLTLTPVVPADPGWHFGVVALAALVCVATNHFLLGGALVLARGVSWRESGILDWSSLTSDLALLCVGAVAAVLWYPAPWFVIPALVPVLFMYQALLIPSLKREVELDSKTGVYNARYLASAFASELERAQRFDRPLSFVMADLDFLREINNAHGHLAGDVVLVSIADIIKSALREYDVAGRFGGEEFGLVLPEVEEDGARVLAERIRQAIEMARITVSSSKEPLQVTMSFGVACFPSHGHTTTELIAAADAAVYLSKQNGRNRVSSATEVPDTARVAVPDVTPAPATQISTTAALQEGSDLPPAARASKWQLPWFVGVTVGAGIAALLTGLALEPVASLSTLAMLVGLATIAELLEVDLFGQGTVSVSVGIAFAAALLSGIEGLATASAAIALVHHVRQRRAFHHIDRAAFNWAVHLLAGLPAVGAVVLLHPSWSVRNLPVLVVASALAAAGYFFIETGLIATAVATSTGQDPRSTWRAQYRWLLGPYVVLCLLGLAMAVSYKGFGPIGTIIYILPIFAMHFVQRQYVAQSRATLNELHQLNRNLFQAALRDYLTGIGNERAYQDALRTRLGDEFAIPFYVARLDVDEFRAINDDYGRRFGDRLLTNLATILSGSTVTDCAFRIAADDFAIFIFGSDEAGALACLERVRRDASQQLGGNTISIGVAECAPRASMPDDVDDQAIAALSEAKRRGRNQVVTYEQIRSDSRITSMVQAQAIRRLLAEETVPVMFQPVWSLDEVGIIGYEALARPKTDRAVLNPQDAFDVATRLGRAHELDALCRRSALLNAGRLPVGRLLFLNVTPESLEQERLTISSLLADLRVAHMQPEQIVLELTERSIVRLEAVLEHARSFQAAGFKLALDDTGAGNAGLSVLTKLQFDFVKVDRAIVSQAQLDRSARAVLAGIFALARETEAFVIVEGIESTEMLDIVGDIARSSVSNLVGVGVQGYLLGRPEAAAIHQDRARSLEVLLADRFGRSALTI